jgi:hypothetical protein
MSRRAEHGARIEPLETGEVGEEVRLATRPAHEHLEVLEARLAL